MPKPRSDSDYPVVTTYTPRGFTRMWNERAERLREDWRRRREETPDDTGLPEPPEAA